MRRFFYQSKVMRILLVFLACDLWRLRFHRPEGLEIEKYQSVDIFVTYCGETLQIIRTTLLAVSRITYQPVQVYVLDDNGSLGFPLPLPTPGGASPS